MAGSFNHIIDDEGKFLSNEDFIGMIENLGDAYEMAEEMYYALLFLANGDLEKIKEAIVLTRHLRRY